MSIAVSACGGCADRRARYGDPGRSAPDDTVGDVQRSGVVPSGAGSSGDLPLEVGSSTYSDRGGPGARLPIALAIGGFLTCATFAAAPDSPFQPVLPAGAEPGGPLTDLATTIGLDRLAGSWLIAAGVLAMGLAVAGFLVLLRETWRGAVSVRTVVVLAVAANVITVTMLPLLFSRDVYSYAFYGRIVAVYGENPYVHTPVEFGADELWPLVGPKWVDTPAVYGPAFTTISGAIARSADAPAGQVDAYRWLAALASLATLAAIVLTARRLRPDRTSFAAAAFGLNPAVLFLTVGSGHNDMLVALALAAGVLLLVHDRTLAAVAVLAIGALIKATVALPLVLVVVWVVARTPQPQRARALASHAGLAIVLGLGLAFRFLQTEDPTLGMLELAGHEGWLAPAGLVGKVFGWLSFGTLGWLARVTFAAVLLIAFVRLARDVARRSVAREPVEAVVAAIGWSLVLLMMLGPVLLPWYAAWALPLAWLLPRPARTTLIATGAALAMVQWTTEPLRFPDAFNVNLAIGHWIVTPTVLVLVIWCVVDLRRRVLTRLPLHDAREAARAALADSSDVATGGSEG